MSALAQWDFTSRNMEESGQVLWSFMSLFVRDDFYWNSNFYFKIAKVLFENQFDVLEEHHTYVDGRGACLSSSRPS